MNIRDDFILKNIHQGYLVGGMIRDFFIAKKIGADVTVKDRDIAIKGAKQFAEQIAKDFEATLITLDDVNKIYRVILRDKENYLDISELRGDCIEDDLLKRDFTINAVAYDLSNNKFIDVTGGMSDIENGIIRSIREENFTDDSLRIIRAYRFMSTTGFVIDEELSFIIKKHLNIINNPAKERVQDEIMKLFGGKYCSSTLIKMYDDGVLELIFPCVKDIAKVPSNTHHHLDLIHHVIETVHRIEVEYSKASGEVLTHLNSVDFGGYPRINHLKIAGFLHDIGKFTTWSIEPDGRHRFIKHDLEGAKIVVPLLKNLKFSNKQIDYISDLIRNHIYPSSVISSPNLDNKVMMRYVRKMENNVIDNIILAKADRLSAQGPAVTQEMTENNINGLNKLLTFYLEVKPTLKPLPKLLDGKEIMMLLNIKQSPMLGEIIKELHEAQLNGDVNTKEDAINFVKVNSK